MKNKLFADHVTSMAFNLSLSRNMIIAMAGIAGVTEKYDRNIYVAMGGRDSIITTQRSLVERGLAYAPNKKFLGVLELTDAGKHVFELLKIAGLIKRIEVVNESFSKKESA